MAMTFSKIRHMASLTSIILVLVYLSYIIFFEPPFVIYTNLPFPVLNSDGSKLNDGDMVHIKAGDIIRLRVDRCSTEKDPRVYLISHMLIGVDTIMLPSTQATVIFGCHSDISLINQVPNQIKPGVYHVEGFSEIPGIVRNIKLHWYSENFLLVP